MVLSKIDMDQLRAGNPSIKPNKGNYIVVFWDETPSNPKFFCQYEREEKESEEWVLCVGHDNSNNNNDPILLVVPKPNERLAWGFCPDSLQNIARRQVEQTNTALIQRLAEVAAQGSAKLWLTSASANAIFGSGVTSGLAFLGGGSVASGGFGMSGGIITIGLATGALATHTAVQACNKLDTTPQNRKAVRTGGVVGTITGAGLSSAAVVACAAEGTGGAAVITSGLAYLGGGSIASGGAGMMGGLAVIAAVPVATVSVAAGIGFAVSKSKTEKANRKRYEKLCNAAWRAKGRQVFLTDYHSSSPFAFGNLSAGQSFNHYDDVRPITKLTVISGAIIDGLVVQYGGFFAQKHGIAESRKSNVATKAASSVLTHQSDIILDVDEFVVMVSVRADPKSFVQSLSFTTNQGNQYGPYGGRGRPFIDKEGVERTIFAPEGCVLIGFMGQSDKAHIHAIGFHWGRICRGQRDIEHQTAQ